MSFEQPEWKILCRMKDDDRVDGKGDGTHKHIHTYLYVIPFDFIGEPIVR